MISKSKEITKNKILRVNLKSWFYQKSKLPKKSNLKIWFLMKKRRKVLRWVYKNAKVIRIDNIKVRHLSPLNMELNSILKMIFPSSIWGSLFQSKSVDNLSINFKRIIVSTKSLISTSITTLAKDYRVLSTAIIRAGNMAIIRHYSYPKYRKKNFILQ